MAEKLAHILTHPETPLHLGHNEMLTITSEPNVTKIAMPWPDDSAEVFAGAKYVFTVGCDVTVRGPSAMYRVPAGSKIVVTASDFSARIELRTSESPSVRCQAVALMDERIRGRGGRRAFGLGNAPAATRSARNGIVWLDGIIVSGRSFRSSPPR